MLEPAVTTKTLLIGGSYSPDKLLSQGHRRAKLVSTLKKFYGRHHDLVDPCSVAASKLVTDLMPIANK